MRVQVLDLDGSILHQSDCVSRWQPSIASMREWGPRIRIACRFEVFKQFALTLGDTIDPTEGCIRLYGSGDFHHVSLAMLSRLTKPFNLLVFDNHPDWMRGIPFMHCGTWLNHAARLPLVRRVFHIGGDVDFDNAYRYLAPWDLLRSRKIVVIPARRRFTHGTWLRIPHSRILRDLEQFRAAPLYVSIDKDVLQQADAITNWDAGHLSITELLAMLLAFIRAADGNLAGVDLLGDWSPVRVDSWLGRIFHRTQHADISVDPVQAAARNQRANMAIIDTVLQACAASPSTAE